MIAVMVIFLVVFVGVGWSLRPPTSGFPSVPENLSVQVVVKGAPKLTQHLTVKSDGAAKLEIKGGAGLPGSTKVQIFHIGKGKVCTPTKSWMTQDGDEMIEHSVPKFRVRVVNALSFGKGPEQWTEVDSVGPGVYVDICWTRDAPVRIVGAYLSAQFPSVTEAYARRPLISSTLKLSGANTADYSIQSPVSPISTSTTSWSWSQTANAQPIHLSAINVTTSQHDNYRAFLSGITLGVAGAALIAIVQELIVPLSRRRDAEFPD